MSLEASFSSFLETLEVGQSLRLTEAGPRNKSVHLDKMYRWVGDYKVLDLRRPRASLQPVRPTTLKRN